LSTGIEQALPQWTASPARARANAAPGAEDTGQTGTPRRRSGGRSTSVGMDR